MEGLETSQSIPARRTKSIGGEAAGFGLRCGAFLVDYIIVIASLAATLLLASWIKRSWMAPEVADFVVIIGYLATAGLIFYNLVYLYVREGRSIGKEFIGLRVVRSDGDPIDYKTALLRHIVGYPVSFLCLGLGVIWILFDSGRQGWHDKLAKTTVVRR